MPEIQAISWGIIGCGDVTEVKSGPAYQKTAGFTLQGVTRRDLDKAKDYAARHGVPEVYASPAELIASPRIDAIYIATPPDSHREYALAAAKAGKPCCIEKPMAPTYAACLEILEAFEASQTPVFVAYYRRCLPRFVKVKEWLDSGEIGAIRHVHWTLRKPPSELDRSKAYNWRTDARIAKGGHFDDLASHGLDLFNYLIGDIETASGHASNQQGLYTALDSISASWRHRTGATGTGFWNFGSHESLDRVEIAGSEGLITFAIFDEAPVSLQSKAKSESLHIPHPLHVQAPHVEALRDHLFGRSTHPSLGRSAAHASSVIEQILAP